MENETISKELETALKGFQAKNNQVPEGYFDQFELELLHKIQTDANAPKQAKVYSLIAKSKKYLVAASLVIAVATGYFFYDNLKTNEITQDEFVQIETLPDLVIETYINNNELVAEVDWNSAIETESASMQINNN